MYIRVERFPSQYRRESDFPSVFMSSLRKSYPIDTHNVVSSIRWYWNSFFFFNAIEMSYNIVFTDVDIKQNILHIETTSRIGLATDFKAGVRCESRDLYFITQVKSIIKLSTLLKFWKNNKNNYVPKIYVLHYPTDINNNILLCSELYFIPIHL